MGIKLKENLLVLGIVIIGIFSTGITASLVTNQIKSNLVTRAQTIAGLLDVSDVQMLQGNESDLTNPEYLLLKNRLIELRKQNKDSRFIYLMRQTNEGIIFLVDSEASDSPDYSPPGQVYIEASDQLISAITKGESGLEIAGDRWGMWTTGYAPLRDPVTGRVVALAGIDLDYYTNYLIPVVAFSLVPFFAFLIIVLIFFYTRRIERVKEEALLEKEQLMKVAQHELGSPMAEVRWMIDNLLVNESVKKDAEALETVRLLYMSSDTILRRIMNLLKASELTTKKRITKKEVDLAAILLNVIQNQKKTAHIMQVSVDTPEMLPSKVIVQGDASCLEIVFSNILAYCMYYTKNKKIQIRYEADQSADIFTFTSAGDSLTKDEADTLFAPYYIDTPMSSHTEGTGYGMYITQKIITMHNGSISVRSDKDGVTIIVKLLKII